MGTSFLMGDKPVLTEGTARIWIIFPEMRKEVHVNRIKVGVVVFLSSLEN